MLWETTQKPVFITLGSLGLAGMASGQFFHWPGVHLEGPVDVVGAGRFCAGWNWPWRFAPAHPKSKLRISET